MDGIFRTLSARVFILDMLPQRSRSTGLHQKFWSAQRSQIVDPRRPADRAGAPFYVVGYPEVELCMCHTKILNAKNTKDFDLEEFDHFYKIKNKILVPGIISSSSLTSLRTVVVINYKTVSIHSRTVFFRNDKFSRSG